MSGRYTKIVLSMNVTSRIVSFHPIDHTKSYLLIVDVRIKSYSSIDLMRITDIVRSRMVVDMVIETWKGTDQ